MFKITQIFIFLGLSFLMNPANAIGPLECQFTNANGQRETVKFDPTRNEAWWLGQSSTIELNNCHEDSLYWGGEGTICQAADAYGLLRWELNFREDVYMGQNVVYFWILRYDPQQNGPTIMVPIVEHLLCQ